MLPGMMLCLQNFLVSTSPSPLPPLWYTCIHGVGGGEVWECTRTYSQLLERERLCLCVSLTEPEAHRFRQAGRQSQGSSCICQDYRPVPPRSALYLHAGDLNRGPHACGVSPLLTGPAHQHHVPVSFSRLILLGSSLLSPPRLVNESAQVVCSVQLLFSFLFLH